MKNVITEYYQLMDSAYEVKGTPRVRAEWNYNNTAEVGVPTFDNYVANDPNLSDWASDKKYFPLESITYSNRPTSGIHYAYLNNATNDSAFTEEPGGLASDRYYALNKKGQDLLYVPYIPFSNQVQPPIQGNHPTYKYWVSESASYAATSVNGGYPINYCTVTVPYKTTLQMNKISFTASLGALPTRMAFSYQKPDLTWVDIMPAGPANVNIITGEVQFWIQANGTWGRTPYYVTDVSVPMVAIKFSIIELDRSLGRAEVIEFSARKELDITSRTTKIDANMSMAEESFEFPIGTVSSNSGTIQISNYDRALDPGGSLGTVVDRQTTITMDTIYDTTPVSATNTQAIVRTTTMHTTDWQRTNQDDFSVNLFDDAKFLQSIPSPDIFEENILLHDLVVQMLDLVGFNNITIHPDLYKNEVRIPWFYTTRDETVWSALQRLCHSTLSVLFVDSYGQFRLLGKKQIAADTDNSQLLLRGEMVSNKPANIVSLNKKYTIETNKVDINYNAKRIKMSTTPFDVQPLTDILWQPTETVFLRAQKLQQDMDLTQTYFFVPQDQAPLWPYKGAANIDGEAVRWYGKEYIYSTGLLQIAGVIYSEAEKRAVDALSRDYYAAAQNHFSGKLMNVQRGADASGYVTTHKGVSSSPANAQWYNCRRPVGFPADANNFYGAYNYEDGLSYVGNSNAPITVQGIDPSTVAPISYVPTAGDLIAQGAGLNVANGIPIKSGNAETTIRSYRPVSTYTEWFSSNNFERQEPIGTQVSLVGMRFKFLDPPGINEIGLQLCQGIAGGTTNIDSTNRTAINQMYQVNFSENQSMNTLSTTYRAINAWQENPNNGQPSSGPAYITGSAQRLKVYEYDPAYTQIEPNSVRGLDYNFERGKWYDVMVQIVVGQGAASNQRCHLAVYVNGAYACGFYSDVLPFLPKTNSWAISSRHSSNVMIENAWSWDSTSIGTGPDGTYQENMIFDNENRALTSGFLNTGVLFPQSGAPAPARDETNLLGYFMYDDFGSIVHEVKEYNVPLTKSPAKSLTGYSDQGNVKFLYVQESADYAQFSVANTGFTDIIVNGEENFVNGNKITHTLLLYGYVLEVDPNVSTLTVTNPDSIKEHLEIKTSITCDWINTPSEAQDLGNWIVNHFSSPRDVMDIEIFPDTVIEVGDKISVQYGRANLDSTQIFIVSGIKTTFDSKGLKVILTVHHIH